MALLSRTVVSLDRPFEDGELIGKTTPPDDLQHRLPPTTSTSTPRRGHATPLTSHFKMAQLHRFPLDLVRLWCGSGATVPARLFVRMARERHGAATGRRFRSSTNWPTHLVSKPAADHGERLSLVFNLAAVSSGHVR
ncbi:hypothetical protein OHA28_01615 [Streptomyces sp. NBC_00269]|uniref:hypothetical protein n=1 Tax=Streptomyces sp. NBC_00269 TaxID=2975696 RepID=UPI002E2E7301|nr:hypothetical protein [Streptomyces sp. NBC_00269]